MCFAQGIISHPDTSGWDSSTSQFRILYSRGIGASLRPASFGALRFENLGLINKEREAWSEPPFNMKSEGFYTFQVILLSANHTRYFLVDNLPARI